jgi:hypothetical protein
VPAFVFDAARPETFAAAVELMTAVATASGDSLPCVLVALNDGAAAPELEAEVAAACSSLAIGRPVALAAPPGAGSAAAVYQTVVQAALQPEGAIPETPSLRATRQYNRMLRRAAIGAAACTVAALAGYFAFRLYKEHRSGGGEAGGGAAAK